MHIYGSEYECIKIDNPSDPTYPAPNPFAIASISGCSPHYISRHKYISRNKTYRFSVSELLPSMQGTSATHSGHNLWQQSETDDVLL